jgi:hypothetical protein
LTTNPRSPAPAPREAPACAPLRRTSP